MSTTKHLTTPVLARLLVIAFLSTLACAGCGGKPRLMPTPLVYTHPEFDPFASVPPELRGSRVEVLYITDRTPEQSKKAEGSAEEPLRYGTGRSRSAAFGVATMRIGEEDTPWDALVRESRTARRDLKLELELVSVQELARFSPTPGRLVISDEELAESHVQELEDEKQAAAEELFRKELAARLAKTPRKEVFIFIHGFNVTFEGGIFSIGELWHFLGREGVPISYSWPAGVGMLRAYTYTEQSTQFTIYHLKEALRLIASCPDVKKVHIIAHSRGSAVAMEALRELYLEIRSTADTQQQLKLGTVVLAAADVDVDVVIARDAAERVGRAVERIAFYICNQDKALSLSTWLTGGSARLGDPDPKMFSSEEIATLRQSKRLQIIDARVRDLGSLAHSYFHENPEVSSDLVLLLRYQLPAGDERGRPLGISKTGFWIIRDGYPGKPEGAWFEAVRQHPAQRHAGTGRAPRGQVTCD